MSTLFAAYVFAVVVGIASAIYRFVPGRYRMRGLVGLAVWVTYMTALGYGGAIAGAKLVPPGLFYMMVPMVMLAVFTARSEAGKAVAMSIPVWFLVGAEAFRFVVELFLHGLWQDKLLPTMMTYHGANFDIVVGASAPVVAWMLATGKISPRLAVLWNVAGIVMLANVAGRGVLTTPGALNLLHTEVPNLAVGTFPYSYIPGVMVPLALILHILAIRALRERVRQEVGVSDPTGQAVPARAVSER